MHQEGERMVRRGVGAEKERRRSDTHDVFIVLGPHNEHIRDGGVGDPGLGAVENVRVAFLARSRLHAARIGAMVGFRQAEAPHQLASR